MNIITIPAGQSIDPYLREFRLPGTRFVLGPGTYSTNGCYAFADLDLCMLAPNCELVGAGSRKTRLICPTPITTHNGSPTHSVNILMGGARTKGTSSSMVVSGLTIEALPLRTCVALHLYTSEANVSDVRVLNLAGRRDAPGPLSTREGFGILINNAADVGVSDGGHVIENCQVHLADLGEKENYAIGIYAGCVMRQLPMRPSVVRGCVVTSRNGHAGYAFNDRTTIKDSESVGFRCMLFGDTGPARESHLIRMKAAGCGWAVDLQGAGDRHGITLRGCEVAFRNLEGWAQAIRLLDNGSGAQVSAVHVEDCTFIAPVDGEASKARLQGDRVAAFTEARNRWIGPWEAPTVQPS